MNKSIKFIIYKRCVYELLCRIYIYSQDEDKCHKTIEILMRIGCVYGNLNLCARDYHIFSKISNSPCHRYRKTSNVLKINSREIHLIKRIRIIFNHISHFCYLNIFDVIILCLIIDNY